MGKVRKGKILVIAILMMIASFFTFTGKASAYWRASYTTWQVYGTDFCKNSPRMHFIIDGVEVEPEDILNNLHENRLDKIDSIMIPYSTYTLSKNSYCNFIALPDADTTHVAYDRYDYSNGHNRLTPIWNINGRGILAWYDNPNYEGDPIIYYDINWSDKWNEDVYFYAKTAPIISIYVEGRKKDVVVGKTYSPTFLDDDYDAEYGTFVNPRQTFNRETYQFDEEKMFEPSYARYPYKVVYIKDLTATQFIRGNKLMTGPRYTYEVPDVISLLDLSKQYTYTTRVTGSSQYYTTETQAPIYDIFNEETLTSFDYINAVGITQTVRRPYETFKKSIEVPRYYEYTGYVDQYGNKYDDPELVIKAEYAGRNFNILNGDTMVCRYLWTDPAPNNVQRFYGEDKIYRTGTKLLSDYDPQYLSNIDVEEGHINNTISTCLPYDVNTELELYIDPSLQTEYSVIANGRTVAKVLRNHTYTLPDSIDDGKPAESIVVKLKYQDNSTPDGTLVYTKTYTPNGFLIDGVHYDFGETILVTKNLIIDYDYDVSIDGPELPTPSRNRYTFKGWYDATMGGHQVIDATSAEYDTLYAQWVDKDYVVVIRPDGFAVELLKGSEFTMPEVPYKYDDLLSRVKFVKNNETDDYTVSQVTKSYKAREIECKETGAHYQIGQKIIVNDNMTLLGVYDETIKPATFPVDPEWINYTFLGWYNQLEGGTRYTEYSGSKDLTLYAHWDGDDTVTITYPNGAAIRGDGPTKFLPEGYSETIEKGSKHKLYDYPYSQTQQSADIYFYFSDGITKTYKTVTRKYSTTNGWYVDGKVYAARQTITADKDLSITVSEVYTYQPATFPKVPDRPGYKFLGWYDIKGNKHETFDFDDALKYNGSLYGKWQKVQEEYTLPEIPAKNPENIATVTLKFQDGISKDKEKYVKKNYVAVDYTVNGGIYDNEHFNVGDTIEMSGDVTITPNYEEEIVEVELYSATREGYMFAGWYDEEEGGTRYYNYSGTEDITLYARWTTAPIANVCRRATTLHTKGNVTYGQIGEPGKLVPGDAFDCDVNGDGVYDPETERFYYINDLWDAETDTFVESVASLVYYSDYYNGPLSSSSKDGFVKYSSTIPNDGPNVAAKILPTTEDWSNVSLYKTTRQLSWPNNSKTNSGGALSTYDYTGYSARMIHGMELFQSGCLYSYNNKILGQYYNLNNSCEFLTENIRRSGDGRTEYSYWIESPGGYCPNGYCPADRVSPDFNKYAWSLVKKDSNEYSSYMYQAQIEWKRGVRPVIDVPKSSMEDVPEHTIYHTITYPEGQQQTSIHGSTFVFGDVVSSGETEDVATVTFKYENGDPDTTAKVQKTRTPVAYKIGNTRYDKGNELIVLDDYQLEYIYVDTYKPASFPSNPTRDGYTFKGWYDAPAGGNKYTSYSEEENITLYAHWEGTPTPIPDDVQCIRAQELHSKVCQSYMQDCTDLGYDTGETITFGNLGTSGELHSGDAFTCDVNGDGNFDEQTERFYYVSDYYDTYTKQFDTDYAALIYDSSFGYNTMYSNGYYYDFENNTTHEGPSSVATYLPSSSLWSNSTLKSLERHIYAARGANLDITSDTASYPTIEYEEIVSTQCTDVPEQGEYQQRCQDVWVGSHIEYNNCREETDWDNCWEEMDDCDEWGVCSSHTECGTHEVCDEENVDDYENQCEDIWVVTTPAHQECESVTDQIPHINDNETTLEYEPYFSYSDYGARLLNIHEFSSATGITNFNESNSFTVRGNEYLFESQVEYFLEDPYDITYPWIVYAGSVYKPASGTTGAYAVPVIDIPKENMEIDFFERYYTITYPNGDTEQVLAGTEWTFPKNKSTKADEEGATVTFDYQNGDENTTAKVTNQYLASGWTVDNAHYNDGAKIVINKDINLAYDYVVTYVSPEFPSGMTREGYEFTSWFDAPAGGTRYETYAGENDITLYAHWNPVGEGGGGFYPVENLLCKRATTLHTEICDGGYRCGIDGYSQGDTIEFGNLYTEGELNPGDAFDCDVNGDGTFDSETERFYYVSDYFDTNTKTFNKDYAALIYYKNVDYINVEYHITDYSNSNSHTPDTISSLLPKTSDWTNVTLKETNRKILNDLSVEKASYSYSGYAARLLTLQEYSNDANPNIENWNDEWNAPRYFLENQMYSSPTPWTQYWLETHYSGDDYVYDMTDYGIDSMEETTDMGARPVIDVPKTRMENAPKGSSTYHSVTYPDGFVEIVPRGTEIVLPSVPDDIIINATVTFKPENGESDIVRTVNKSKIYNGIEIDGTTYDAGSSFTVNKDIVMTIDFDETNISAEFPEDPTKEGVEFLGWFNAKVGGDRFTEYDDDKDITLYAHYSTNQYTLPTNNTPKDDEVVATVTFKYHNGDADTTANVIKTYKPHGWLVDGVPYENGAVITKTDETVIEPNYDEFTKNADFPANPTKDDYEFVGWFTAEENGTLVTVYNGDEDITLHAVYSNNYAYLIAGSRFIDKATALLPSGKNPAMTFRKATESEYNEASLTTDNIVSTEDSPNEVYMWKDNTEILYYSEADVIFANNNASNMFGSSIFGDVDVTGINFSKTTNMNFMFANVSGTKTLTGMNTSNVTSMRGMFSYNAVEPNVSSFDTSNVEDMQQMFFCSTYSNLNVSNFDTHNVTSMDRMFAGDGNRIHSKFTTLDLTNFDTGNVTTFNHMFYHCRNLQTLHIENFDTHNARDFTAMISWVDALTEVDVTNFDTSSATTFEEMFRRAYGLTSLDLSNFDTTNVTSVQQMFETANHLQTVYVSSKWDVSNAAREENMFNGASNIVGQRGTTYDSSHKGKDYAVVDYAPERPGYLTFKGFYVITFPDGTKIEVEPGTEFTFPSNTVNKDSIKDAIVTFKYNDGVTDDYETYVGLDYINAGWKEGNTYFEDGQTIIVDRDITLEYNYVETATGATFPSDPTRSGYTFKGWFDSLAGGEQYTSYNDNKDLTLYARWKQNECTNPIEYTLGTNDIAKADEVIGTVTFKYHNGSEDTTSNVIKQYYPDGWLVDGVQYRDGEIITKCDSTVIEPYYGENIVYADFPSNPTKSGYEFTGWFTEEAGGESVAVLNRLGDTVVHAQYTNDYAEFVDGDSMHYYWIVKDYGKHDMNFRKATLEEYNSAVRRSLYMEENQSRTSPKKIYTWLDGDDFLYYSDASVIFMNPYANYFFGSGSGYPTLIPPMWKHIDVSGINFSRTHSFLSMFAACENLTDIVFGDNFVTYNATDMTSMFENCPSLTEIDLSHFDTSKVGSNDPYYGERKLGFTDMFNGCSSLTELDLSGFKTENVLSMDRMFAGCSSLTELDLSSFDTSSIGIPYYGDKYGVARMFAEANNLETIYVSDKWDVSNASDEADYYYDESVVFLDNDKLVGQNGTAYSSDHKGKDYAIIDNAPENPGYLTLKSQPRPTTYTITYPDGETEKVPAGTEFKFPSNVPEKDSENIATVTFKPENDTEDIVKYVTKAFINPGWKIEDTHYDIGDIYVVNSDITLAYDYIETIIGVEFPADPTLDDDVFLGWFNNRKGGTQYTSYSGEEDIVLFAHWQNGGIPSDTLCKKASTLHTQKEGRTTVTYGQLETNGILETGDAFDCDVNGDGIYDSETERFYYISDYYDTNSKSFDNSYATLVYYTQTKAGEIYDKSLLSYYQMNGTPYNNERNEGNGSTHPVHYSGPAAVSSELPTTSQWSNVTLKTTNRKILDDQGNTNTEYDYDSRVLDSYNYSGKAARLLTLDEVRSGCNNISIDDNMCDIDCTVYVDSSCSFLTEQVPNNGTRNLGATKLETRFHNNYSDFFIVSASESDPEEIFMWMDATSSVFTSMVRPTIDVPKDKIDLRVVQKYSIYIDNEKVDEIEKNKSYTVPNNTKAKESEEGATVTFKPNNGEEDIIRKVTKSYTPNGYKLGDKLYQEGDKIVVNSDINLISNYNETNAVLFPDDPVKPDYTFEGWFDSRNNGTMYTSYNGNDDLTLYAQYSTDKPEPGTIYNLGVNNTPKADTTSVVTFKYQDGETADTQTTIVKQYVPNGWTVNGTPYPDNGTVTYEEDMVIEPAYVETIVSGTWPSDPTRYGYEFKGWFNAPAGGNKYTINEIQETITLYAHWYGNSVTPIDGILCYRATELEHDYDLGGDLGNLGTEGELNSGDAYLCDVNGDGNYNERFYYVSDYYDTHTKQFDNTYVAMIYSGMWHSYVFYGDDSPWSGGVVYNGPTGTLDGLPSTSQWSNVSLYQTQRAILTHGGNSTTTIGGTTYNLPTNFDYSGRAARSLTVQEFNAGCGTNISSGNSRDSFDDNCDYMVGFMYQPVQGPGDVEHHSSFYLENPVEDEPYAMIVASTRDIESENEFWEVAGTKPVIDVPKDAIDLRVAPTPYTIYYPDGSKESVAPGTVITIPSHNNAKASANGATVTFKPENGGSDIVRYVTMKYTPNGYKVALDQWSSGTHYDVGSTYTVNSNIFLKYDWTQELKPVEFPNDIIKAGYELDDWYTEANGQGDKVSSYNGISNITLYANWTKKTSGKYTLPENTIGRDPENVATVTFVYNNGKANTTSKVVATYTPDGWLVDGQPKNAGDVITMTPDTVLEPRYVRTVSPAAFPANPTRTNFVFKGWVDNENYNSTDDYNYYTTYDGGEDLTLYAKWETDDDHCSITYSDGEVKVVTCGTNITVPTEVNTESETITFNYMTYWYDDMMDYTEKYETSFNRTFYTKASVENYKIGDNTYNPGESFTVSDDIYVERNLGNPIYNDEPFSAPDEAYKFVAWFTDWNDGVQVKSYYDYKSKGLTTHNLYGHYNDYESWDDPEYSVVVDGVEVGTFTEGTSYTAPAGTDVDEDLATVTLINGETTNTYKVHKTGTFNNYKVELGDSEGYIEEDGTLDAGSSITVNSNIFLTSQYNDEVITGVDLPVLESNEYTTFKGWYKNENGSGPKYSGTYTDPMDITLYAYFDGKSATVYYYADETENAELIYTGNYKYGDTVDTSNMAVGGTVPGKGKLKVVYQNGTTANDLTIPLEVTKQVDHWKDDDSKTYNKVYVVDFIGAKALTPVFGEGSVISLTLPDPEDGIYPGYTFTGWYTEPQGGTRVTKITEDKDTTIYAHWIRNNDPVCIFNNGRTEECNPGDSKTVPFYDAAILGHVYEIANGIGSHYNEIVRTIDITRYDMIEYYEIDGVRYNPGDTYEITDNQTNIKVKYTDSIRNPITLDGTKKIKDNIVQSWYDYDGVERSFMGWYTERTGGELVVSYDGTEDLYVYAHCIENSSVSEIHEVTFNKLDNSHYTIKVPHNTVITIEQDIYKEPGIFYLDPNNGDSIKSVSMIATITANNYAVNDEIHHVGDQIRVTKDLAITSSYDVTTVEFIPDYPDPVKEGYVFTGWYDGDERIDYKAIDPFGLNVIAFKTLVAHYEEYNPVTDVIVDFDGDIRVVPKGTTEILPTTGSKTEDTFDITFDTQRGLTQTISVNRQYTLTGYTVNGDSYNPGAEVTYNVDTTVRSQYDIDCSYAQDIGAIYPELPSLAEMYSDFTGWSDASGNIVEDASNITSDITLYARYLPKYNLTVDGVTTEVPEGYIYTVPNGSLGGDSISFTLDYNYPEHDSVTEEVTIASGKGVKYQLINGDRYDVNETFVVFSDTVVTSVTNDTDTITMIPEISEPSYEGYYFAGWADPDMVPVDIYKLTPADKYYDGKTFTGFWQREQDPEENVTIRLIDEYTKTNMQTQVPKGAIYPASALVDSLTLENSFNSVIYNNINSDVINMTVTTSANISHFLYNGVRYENSADVTFNENGTLEVIRNIDTTITCDDSECPDILYQKPNTTYNDYLFSGVFDGDNNLVDISKLESHGSPYDDRYEELIIVLTELEDSIILTVDDEVSIIPKGMGTIPAAKTKASDVYKVTYDYNDGTNRKFTDNIVGRYTFEHYYVVGKGEYEAGAEYNYLENTTMNSVFTRSIEYPEMRTIKTENFIGWFTEPHGGEEVTTLEGIERDIVLYARYNNEHVTIYIDNVANPVLYGEEFTLPVGIEKSDKSITFTLDYNYDNRTEDYTIGTSYEFTGYEMDGNNYEAGYTFEATEDKYVTSQYDLTNTFTPEYTEPEREGYIFNGWFNGTEKVNVSELTAENAEINGKTLTASWTEVTPDDVVVTYDGEQRVVPIGTKLSELGDSPIKPSDETFTVYIDRNNGTFIIDTYEITKSYSLDKVYINGEELNENDYTFNEDTTVTTSYTASYEPNIFEGLTSDISGIFTEAVGGVKVENYDNVNDGDTLYYQYGETHTVTLDGEVIATVPHGSEYTLPVNTKPRNMENIATVTFDYGDGRDPYITYVRKRFNSNGWSINGDAYANNEKITVNEDIVLEREYYETIQGIEFPGTPKRSGYRFNGWYYNDEEITSYNGTDDITITANWIKLIIITYLDDGSTEIVDAGTTKVFEPVSDTEEVFHNITFKYNYENCPEDKVVRISSHGHYVGWTINGIDEYNNGDEITFNENSTVKARYEDVISNKNLPEDPVREGYDFLGWYDGRDIGNSNKVDITKIAKTMTVYGQYKVSGEHMVYFDGRKYTYTDATSVDTESLGFMSDTKENVLTLTLDYQNKSIENESIDYTIVSTFVNWTDENGETYGKVIDLTNVSDGMHFTSNYDTEEFTPVDLSEYDPEVNDFEGWFTDKTEGRQVTTYDGEGSVTYYAQYGEIKQVIVTIDGEVTIYSVGETFNLPENSIKSNDEIVITFDPQNGEEVFTKSIVTSYTFTGFRLDTDNELYQGETEFTANTDMTFTSEYTSNTTGDTWPSDPEKENYIFLGWYTNQTSGIEVFNFDGITSNTSLYAHYTTDDESFVTLTNTVTGESLKVQKSTDWLFNESKFNKDNKEKLGTITYKFNSTGYPVEVKDYYRISTPTGYYIEGDDTLYNIDEAHQFTSDTNITPYYGNVVTDSHVGIDQFDYEITNGDKQIKCFSKTNQTDPHDDEEYTCYENYDENDGDVTVYLHWKELKKITVTEPNGDTNEYTEGDTYNTGVNSSSKNSDGYTVTFKYQDGTTDDTTQEHRTSYTANGWLINGEHVDNNTDITLEEDLVKEYDYTETSTTITLPEPTRDDYTFAGWNSRANGKGTTYDNDSINALDKDTTVYAIWTKEEINITFIENGGSDVDDMTIGYDTPIGDLPTTSKENERVTENNNDVIIGYIFDGWYRDPEFTSKVSSTTTFTDDATLYAKWVEDRFPYVYPYHEENFVCTGSNYIDTGVKLYTQTNNDYLKDFEVGFTIESYNPSGQAKQAVFFNAKWEVSSLQWPGVAFRRKDETINLELSSSAKKTRVAQDVTGYTIPLEVRIYRIDNVIYLSTDGGETKTQVQDTTGFSQFFDVNSYFCAGDNGNGGIQRYVKGTISNYYIKLGDYQGTAEDLDTHTVTYPDGTIETYGHNSIIDLPSNESSKASNNGASVTFDYNDGVTPIEIRYVTRNYTPNGFIVNGTTHYDDNSTLVVDEDKVLTNDYISENAEVEFPGDPTRENYTFDGWFDENDNEVKYYDGDDDITLTAHWTGELIPIITPQGREDVEYGTEYTIPNDVDKNDDVVATVTFKYHNGDDDTTSDVVKSYTQTGWVDLDEVSYTSGQVITVTHALVLTPVYEESITGATWPADPTRENADFLGWFTEQSGGVAINEYTGTSDITVHAQWDIALPTDFDLDADDLVIVKGETHQIEVTFIPDGSSDSLTYTSSDEDIATVSDEGLITAVEKGVITIIVSADNADIDKVITVTVVSDKLESDEYEVRDDEFESDTYRIVIGAEALTTIGEFKDNMLNDNEYIKIYDLDNNELTDDDIVMTGLIIKLEINGVVHDEATMVVRGDVDGDGIINVSDLLGLINHIRENTLITEYPKFAAANVDEDEILNVSDQLKLNNYLRENIDSLNE